MTLTHACIYRQPPSRQDPALQGGCFFSTVFLSVYWFSVPPSIFNQLEYLNIMLMRCTWRKQQEAGMYLRNELRAHAAVYKAIKALPGREHFHQPGSFFSSSSWGTTRVSLVLGHCL